MREMGFVLTREQELRAANIPFDERDEALRDLFFLLLHRWQEEEPIEQPGRRYFSVLCADNTVY